MEAKYRLVTTWPEDSVQVRDRTSNEILVEMKPHELVTMKNTFDQAREALKHFASNDDWGRVLAWIVGGAPSRQEGIEMARKIVKWQSQAEQSLAAMEATS